MERASHRLLAWAVVGITVLAAAAPAHAGPHTKPGKTHEMDIPALAAALGQADVDTATRAAKALGATSSPEALDTLLDALALGLHPQVAAAALDAVAAHADARAYATVAFFLRYRDPRVRRAAVAAMGALEHPRSTAHMLAALADGDTSVRAAAIEVIAARKVRRAIEPMVALFKHGDQAAGPALAAMADVKLAMALGELAGVAPDALLARTLGVILRRPDFGPEAARVQVVRALGKVPGPTAIAELERYVASVPASPPRQSRREAAALAAARTTGSTGTNKGSKGGATP